MKVILATLCLTFLCGCVNIGNRVFGDGPVGRDTYFSTQEAIAFCTFITVPQVMSPDSFEFHWINIITIPVGACCFIVDVPLEFVCDTICYPYDKYVNYKATKAK